MKTIFKKNFSIEDIIKSCISNSRSKNIKDAYIADIESIDLAHQKFNEIMEQKIECDFSLCKNFPLESSKENMKKLYSNYFSKKTCHARKYYDEIIASASKCPFCESNIVANLDHFLIKSDYYILSISPYNLVPICRDCNSGSKGQQTFSFYSESHLHPYYDTVNTDIWLNADVEKLNDRYKITLIFKKPDDFDDILFKRIKNHFKIFELDKLFLIKMHDEIENNKQAWSEIKNEKSVDDVRYLLKIMSERKNFDINSWEIVLYRNIYNNEWFLNEYL